MESDWALSIKFGTYLPLDLGITLLRTYSTYILMYDKWQMYKDINSSFYNRLEVF